VKYDTMSPVAGSIVVLRFGVGAQIVFATPDWNADVYARARSSCDDFHSIQSILSIFRKFMERGTGFEPVHPRVEALVHSLFYVTPA
jgi:hypothetical protein